jgi:DNA-binding beta-propeller fold protein YncE
MLLARRRMLAAISLPLLAAAGWRAFSGHVGVAGADSADRVPAARAAGPDLLAVTCASGRQLAIVDPERGVLDLIETGAAPHGLALHPDGRAFVATAEGLAVLDVAARQRVALVPYSVDVGAPRVGEYRPGGMGIAITPDGNRVAVGVYRSSGPSILDVFEPASLTLTTSVPVGIRPFQVLAASDSRRVYSIDHDSYSVTVVDLDMMQPQPLQAMPLGRGAYDKPHYAAQRADGSLLLPYQGRTLQMLDPTSGTQTLLPLSAQTHQHGVALSADERRLLIVGTGAAGEVSGGPSLTILDLTTGSEEIVPLTKPHERIALSQDGRRAFLTGGYLLTGGWNGITVVDLDTRVTREVAVPDAPLDIALLPPATPAAT